MLDIDKRTVEFLVTLGNAAQANQNNITDAQRAITNASNRIRAASARVEAVELARFAVLGAVAGHSRKDLLSRATSMLRDNDCEHLAHGVELITKHIEDEL